MKSETEIKEAQETIKTQLTRVDTEMGRAMLQGQFASLEWILSEDENKNE